MLDGSSIAGAEEWAIHDYEGFYGYRIAESECFASVSKLAAFIEQHGKLAAEIVSYFGDIERVEAAFKDYYIGQYDSVEDYAREVTEETTQLLDQLGNFRRRCDYTAAFRLQPSDIK